MDNGEERGKPDPPFFLLDCSKRKERVHDLIWIVNNNKIVLWSSHIFRTYHRFYYFLLFEYFRNLLSAMLYWPVSYHGSRVDRWSKEFYSITSSDFKKGYPGDCQPLNQRLLRNAKKNDYFISFLFHFLLLTWFSFSNICPNLFFFHRFDSFFYF